MVNVDLYSSESLLLLLSAVTWSKQCPRHVQHMWFGPPANTRMFSSIIQIHTDLGFICLRNLNLGTSLNFCVRCLLTKCSLLLMITLLFLMTFFFFFYIQKNLFITDCDSDASPESWYTCIFWRVFLQVKETIPNKKKSFYHPIIQALNMPKVLKSVSMQCVCLWKNVLNWSKPVNGKLQLQSCWSDQGIISCEITAVIPLSLWCVNHHKGLPRLCWNSVSLDFIHVQELSADGSNTWNQL